MISRRAFLGTGIAAPLLRAQRRIPIALQLFSVRSQCELDLSRTLARVRQIGFTGVELAGDYGYGGGVFRKLLDDNSLVCCGAHVSLEQIQPPKYQSTLGFMRTLGNQRVIVPGLPEKYTRDLAGWRGAAAVFTQASDRLTRSGLELGYHNHAIEFKNVDGSRPLDAFLGSTSSNVFLELDLGNAGYGGADPVRVLEKYRSRVKMIHVKDYTESKPDLLIGTGSMNWPDLVREAQSSAVDWYVIEHDSTSGPDLSDIEDSWRRFVRLLSI